VQEKGILKSVRQKTSDAYQATVSKIDTVVQVQISVYTLTC